MIQRATLFEKVVELLAYSTLYPTGATFKQNVSKTNPKNLIENGKVLKKQINDIVSYYKEIVRGDASTINSPKVC